MEDRRTAAPKLECFDMTMPFFPSCVFAVGECRLDEPAGMPTLPLAPHAFQDLVRIPQHQPLHAPHDDASVATALEITTSTIP